jgi:hypothetical protein
LRDAAASAVGFTPCGVQFGLKAWSHAEMSTPRSADGVRTSADARAAISLTARTIMNPRAQLSWTVRRASPTTRVGGSELAGTHASPSGADT